MQSQNAAPKAITYIATIRACGKGQHPYTAMHLLAPAGVGHRAALPGAGRLCRLPDAGAECRMSDAVASNYAKYVLVNRIHYRQKGEKQIEKKCIRGNTFPALISGP